MKVTLSLIIALFLSGALNAQQFYEVKFEDPEKEYTGFLIVVNDLMDKSDGNAMVMRVRYLLEDEPHVVSYQMWQVGANGANILMGGDPAPVKGQYAEYYETDHFRIFDDNDVRIFGNDLLISEPGEVKAKAQKCKSWRKLKESDITEDYISKFFDPREDAYKRLLAVVSRGNANERSSAIPEFVFVEGGVFKMGCTSEQSDCDDDEKDIATVLVKNFQMSKTEITVGQYRAFCAETGNRMPPKSDSWKDNHPIHKITISDALRYCRWLSSKVGKDVRLPLESEWEYAARGGKLSKGYKFAGSNNLKEIAWFEGNYDYNVQPVGSKRPNELGIYDLSGNVREFCNIDYDFGRGINVDGFIHRGGSIWSPEEECRNSNRLPAPKNAVQFDFGFRVAY
ncbi:MAG: SUMF1/EgtB/PvdO family nonheme iron enzyme [Bacteroidota bacterium]